MTFGGFSLDSLYKNAKASGLSDSQIIDKASKYLSSGNSGSSVASSLNQVAPSSVNVQSIVDQITKVANQTSAQNLAYAEQQQNWAANQANIANGFNAEEAAKNRDWQAYMSNTAHQREIVDLRAAGLNPVLSAMNGNGAAVTSGAAASANLPSGSSAKADSISGSIVQLLGSMLAAQTSLANQAVSAKTAESVADKYTAMSKLVAEMDNATRRYSTDVSSWTSLSVAEKNAAISKYAAELQASSARYGYTINNKTAWELAKQELEWKADHPQNFWGTLNEMFNDLFGGSWTDVFSDFFHADGSDQYRGQR